MSVIYILFASGVFVHGYVEHHKSCLDVVGKWSVRCIWIYVYVRCRYGCAKVLLLRTLTAVVFCPVDIAVQWFWAGIYDSQDTSIYATELPCASLEFRCISLADFRLQGQCCIGYFLVRAGEDGQ